MFEPSREPGLTALEAALNALTPTPAAINRDVLLFRAGQASVKRRWLWPTTSGVLAAVAASLAIALLVRPPPDPVREVHYVQAAVPVEKRALSEASASVSDVTARDSRLSHDPSYLQQYRSMQNQLLRWGLDAVPSPHRLAIDRGTAKEGGLLRTPATDPSSSFQPWYQQLFQLGDRL